MKYRFQVTTKAGDHYEDEHEMAGTREIQLELVKIMQGAYAHHNPSGALTFIPWHNIDNIYVAEVDND